MLEFDVDDIQMLHRLFDIEELENNRWGLITVRIEWVQGAKVTRVLEVLEIRN